MEISIIFPGTSALYGTLKEAEIKIHAALDKIGQAANRLTHSLKQ